MKHLAIYTDGSYLRGWIGYAAVCLWDGHRRDLWGRTTPSPGATTGLAELSAVWLALSSIAPRKRPEWTVTLYSDCQVVVEALKGNQNPRDLRDVLPDARALMAEFASCEVIWQRKDRTEWNRRAHELANAARWGRLR